MHETTPREETMKVINAAEAYRLLEEVVEDRGPENRYVSPDKDGRCVYYDSRRDCPSCMVGDALYRAGVPLTRLALLDEEPNGSIGAVAKDIPEVTITNGAAQVFVVAQARQDSQHTYSVALHGAWDALGDRGGDA